MNRCEDVQRCPEYLTLRRTDTTQTDDLIPRPDTDKTDFSYLPLLKTSPYSDYIIPACTMHNTSPYIQYLCLLAVDDD